jgi:hypothetical protein
LSSPEWLAHSRASSSCASPNFSGPPESRKGRAWKGFSAERVKVGYCGSPAQASRRPAVSTTAIEPAWTFSVT